MKRSEQTVEEKQHEKQTEPGAEIQDVMRLLGGRGSQAGDVALLRVAALADDPGPAGRAAVRIFEWPRCGYIL